MFRQGTPLPEGYQGQIEAMAIELGVDLDAAIEASAMSLSAVHRMMQHCAACSEHKTCAGFLETRHGLIEAPPSYCVDRKVMLFLHDQVVLSRPAPQVMTAAAGDPPLASPVPQVVTAAAGDPRP